MADKNDILFNEYSLDFFGFLKLFFDGSAGATSNTGGSGGSGAVNSMSSMFSSLIDFLASAWAVLTVLSWLVSALLIFGLVYAYIRANQLGDIEAEELRERERLYADLYKAGTTNNRWNDVLAHSSNDNPNDWKLAIIEADIMLEELLEIAGYAGNTVGEKLKSASPQSFSTLDQAWRAHRVRNQIAHQGADFVLTKKLAQETITQYKMVFQEFGLV